MKKYVYQTVTSTQDLAKKYLKNGGLERACFVADEQTAGYGKRGRHFYSPVGQGLYLSLALPKFHFIKEKMSLLTPAVATAIVRQLKNFYPDKNFTLKWVNDIYLDGKKIAGILTERVAAGLVIGVGINLAEEKFPNNLKTKADSLHDSNFKGKDLSSKVIKAILRACQSYQTGEFLAKYKRLSLVMDKEVTLQLGKEKITGRVLNIDQNGCLVLQHDEKVDHFSSGEVIKVKSHLNRLSLRSILMAS